MTGRGIGVDGRDWDWETLAVRSGLRMKVQDTLATVPAISPSTTYSYDDVEDVHRALEPGGSGFAYGRNANPTVVIFEEAMAALEGAEEVVAFGSGMAAVSAAILGSGIESGDAIVAATDLYGVTRSLLAQLAGLGIATTFVDAQNHAEVESALEATGARALYAETISNPLLRVADVAALTELAHRHRAAMMVDNTFATPLLLRPLELRVDVVIHSATKYIAGHGDVIAGVVAASRSRAERIRQTRTLTGGIISPFEAWLALRGLRTLPVRMERQTATACDLARWLEEQPWVERVHYPGLPSHANYELSRRQFDDRFPAILAFDLTTDEPGAIRFINNLRLITSGTSLGDVASLVLYPSRTSHRGLTAAELRAIGIGPGLIRLAVGLESPADLKRDLEAAALSLG